MIYFIDFTGSDSIEETITDDTYTYQQENDPGESLLNDDSSTMNNNIQSNAVSVDPSILMKIKFSDFF